MTRRFFMALLMLGFAGAAHADVISLSEDACRNAKEGAACNGDSGHGTCQPDRCCRNDYSDGPPPKQVCSDCLSCKTAPATPEKPPAEKAPVEKPPVEKPPAEKAPAEKIAAPEKRGCDVSVAGGPFGLGALALGLLLAIGLRRSRR